MRCGLARATLQHPPIDNRADVRSAQPNRELFEIAKSVRRKVAWRILPVLFLIYLVAYLDRANISFAKLKMKDDLDFTETVFGWGIGLFFVGYLFLEIPGALLVERWSARKWFARILITWGLCSMAMALVQHARPVLSRAASCSAWPRPDSSPA